MPFPGGGSKSRDAGSAGSPIDVQSDLVIVFFLSFLPYLFFFRLLWGVSSVGRASGSHPEGHEFDSRTLHQYQIKAVL